jgi:formylglycine-generating enzyme required for sulfatase activity
MVLVPGGDFMMGVENGADDERPVHRVSVRDLCMDRTEVTVAAYLSCVAREACRPPSASVEYGDLSDEQRASENRYCDADATGTHNAALNCVSFTQASAYGETMGKRLPTEEEWEHAARGGAEQRLYPWGAEPPGPQLLNACGSECVTGFAELGVTLSPMYAGSDGFVGVAPVGRFPAGDSRDGIHDLAGNVGEWTASPYCPYPRHDCKSPYRVFRGGSFQTEISARARAGARVYSNPDYRYMQVGFRCAADAARP